MCGKVQKKKISKVTKLIKNYLWAGANQNNRCKVVWDQCCEKLKFCGLGLMDLSEAKNALLV